MVSKGEIALIFICGLTTFSVAWFFFSGNPVETFMEYVNRAKQLITGVINNYVEGFKQHPFTVITTTGAAITFIGGFFYKVVNYVKSKSAVQVQKAEDAALQARASELTMQSKLGEAEKKIAVYEKDGDAVTALKTINTDLQAKYDSLKRNSELTINQVTTQRETTQRNFENMVKWMSQDPQLKKRWEDYVQTM